MTNLDSILIGRDIMLPTKVCIVKAMVFPVVMYRYGSWTIKKAKCQRFDAFKLSYWRRLLRVPWTARRWNQSVLKGINLEYSLKGLMLKLTPNTLATWFEEVTYFLNDPDAGKDWGQEKGVTEDELVVWYHQSNGHEFEQTQGDSEGQGSLACCSPWGCKELDTT